MQREIKIGLSLAPPLKSVLTPTTTNQHNTPCPQPPPVHQPLHPYPRSPPTASHSIPTATPHQKVRDLGLFFGSRIDMPQNSPPPPSSSHLTPLPDFYPDVFISRMPFTCLSPWDISVVLVGGGSSLPKPWTQVDIRSRAGLRQVYRHYGNVPRVRTRHRWPRLELSMRREAAAAVPLVFVVLTEKAPLNLAQDLVASACVVLPAQPRTSPDKYLQVVYPRTR
ncbi:hypothetical protein Pmani_038374 [Petrolisthes manimaculis]|uniref:Uncharacterized protein n=1 Tax=Petrolisthes manimaculis TaxID=1843537 RepID=A0AAE1NGG3_9EUCA|nr:hypothetical protein Pmani_038374 [Petrolisthes manimaculis]